MYYIRNVLIVKDTRIESQPLNFVKKSVLYVKLTLSSKKNCSQKCYENQGSSTIMVIRIELRIFEIDSISDIE